MTQRHERAKADVERLDKWLNDHPEDHDDWRWVYRQLRRSRARITRTRVAMLRLDIALNGESVYTRAALEAMAGAKLTYGR
jgi:hypothetical protein